jgi:hypothetical protein
MISGSGDIQRDCGYCREVWPVKLRLSKSYATRAVPLDGRADGRIIDNPTAGVAGVCICYLLATLNLLAQVSSNLDGTSLQVCRNTLPEETNARTWPNGG